MTLDFEKARRGVLDILKGKVNTVVAVKVVQAMKDAAVKPAHWEPSPVMPGYVRCSGCHNCHVADDWLDGKKWKHCPECGAPMENGGNG